MSLLPLVILAVLVGMIAIEAMTSGMEECTLTGLKNACTAVRAGYAAIDGGDYELNREGHLMKGSFDLSADEHIIDAWMKDVAVDVTIFYGDTRMSTSLRDSSTNERIVGTQASEAVAETVLNQGLEYKSTDVVVNGKDYYAYYMPLTNGDGTVVGMVFAGTPRADVEAFIIKKVAVIAGVVVVLLLIAFVVSFLFAQRIARAVKRTQGMLDELAQGNLNMVYDERILHRKDELGSMVRAVESLNTELKEIIGNIQRSSETVLHSGNELTDIAAQTSHSASEISSAVDGISKGAASQAEEVETATGNVADMGSLIEDIVADIEMLSEASLTMQQSGESSSQIMNELRISNDLTSEAIQKIATNIQATDHSVEKIQDAVSLISNIASQTNLLSLNASIEAARAGEAGRGFAVVASEIQQLAEESNQAAGHIAEIIAELSKDSHQSMEVMGELNERLANQEEKLKETMSRFREVSNGIDSSKAGTDKVSAQAQECDQARENVVNVISNLSAISQENAASAAETTASMDELNATIGLLAESADKLKGLAASLEENTRFFKM